ncbi:hypothetical protein BH10ACI2_BH10ACI2_06170 [soil metagenome]
MSDAIKKPLPSIWSSGGFWLCSTFLFLSVFAFHGKQVPFSNEFVYLLRLEPGFLPNDWTFSHAANEHWLFNTIFSIPTYFLPLTTVGWVGRIAVWCLCLAAVVKLGRKWEIPYWAIAISVTLWLASGQSPVAEEWIFGGFEAKAVSYVCLLFALDQFSERKIFVPSILLGLTFSFHPAVGLWAIPAVGLALLIEKSDLRSLSKVVGIVFLFSLPGVLPLLSEQVGADASVLENWKFMVLTRLPWHLDPFQFPRRGIALLSAMLVFCIVGLWNNKSYALRFLVRFQATLGVFFIFGIVLRYFEEYTLLRLMPMRLFPVFTPLLFLFSLFYLFPQLNSIKTKVAVSILAVLMIVVLDPHGMGYRLISETVESWTAKPDDLNKALSWISENTPNNALVVGPPHSRELWFLSKRAQIVSYTYPRYDRMTEWRKRIGDLSGNAVFSDPDHAMGELDTAFNDLSPNQIETIRQNYSADYLVSRAVYPYHVIFETGTYKVYQLTPN